MMTGKSLIPRTYILPIMHLPCEADSIASWSDDSVDGMRDDDGRVAARAVG